MIRVTLYSKADCSLCDQARRDLESLQAEHPHQLVEIAVDSDAALEKRYGEAIPVVQIGPYVLRAPFDLRDLRVALAAARDRSSRVPALSEVTRRRAIRADRLVLFLARHWLGILNLLLFLYVGLPFAAPTLMKLGATRPARWVYAAYSPLCHQLGYRSWFLFGEQAAYPRGDAGTSLISFGQATGLDENDVAAARAFIGNERLGYKVAFCQRDIAIYGSMFLGGVAFAFLRRRLKPLPIWLWFLIGVLPIGIDGGTQLIGAFPFFSALARESTPFLRSLTGGLFGLMNVWMAYPLVQESMDEVRTALVPKLAGVEVPSQDRVSPLRR